MRLFSNPGNEPSFQKIVIISFVLHFIFITVAVIPISTRKREIKSYYVDLINPSLVRRAVPAKKKTGKKAAVRSKKIPPKKNIKPKARMSFDSAKVDSAIEKLKLKKEKEKERAEELANIKERIKERIKEDAAKAAEAEEVFEESSLYAGLGIDDARAIYRTRIKQMMEGYWELPIFDIEGLEAVFDIRVDRDWKIISSRMIKSSGNSLFDRSAKKALENAEKSTEFYPLPVPPLDMHKEILEDGLEFTFVPDQ